MPPTRRAPPARRAVVTPGHTDANPIVLFDGDCGLCARSIRFVARRDGGAFRFAPLSGPAAARLLSGGESQRQVGDTLVLVDAGRVFTRSTAVLRIAARLSRPWCWARVLLVVPRAARDLAYDAVARRRLRWFGDAGSCGVPSPDLRARLLE